MSEIGQSVPSFIKWFKSEEKPAKRYQQGFTHLTRHDKLAQVFWVEDFNVF